MFFPGDLRSIFSTPFLRKGNRIHGEARLNDVSLPWLEKRLPRSWMAVWQIATGNSHRRQRSGRFANGFSGKRSLILTLHGNQFDNLGIDHTKRDIILFQNVSRVTGWSVQERTTDTPFF
jgi:hypothetical protein